MTDIHAETASMRDRSHVETNAIFERLRKLKQECGSNKHDQAIVLISACIEEGMVTSPRIVGALKQLGLNARHVGMILKDGTGKSPHSHRWQRDEAGRYSLHDES